MNCPNCNNPDVIMESVGANRTRAKCQKCGWAEVQDQRGKPMLTEVPHTDKRRVLTENFS
jgi:hypothetical protein